MTDPHDGPTPWSRSTTRLALALLLCAVAVRPLAVSLGPILPDIQDDVGVSAVLAGLLGMVPVVCLGLFAPLGVTLTRHVRPETALAIALGLAVGFGAARAIAPDVGWLLVLTIGLGIGMGLAGPLPAMIIKARAPDRPATLTSVHGLGIVVGSVLGAVLIVPLALIAGGWRGATVLISIPLLLSSVVGLVLLGRGRARLADVRPTTIPWRDGTAWLLAGIFGLQSFVYWGLVIWLAAILVEDGWTTAAAGSAVAVYQVGSFSGVVIIGIVGDRWGTRRQQLLAASGGVSVALLGLLALPVATIVWVALAGVSLGAALPLALTLPVDLGVDDRDAGAKSGLMLLGGYLIAAGGPAVVGLIREVTLERTPVFVALLTGGLVFLALSSRVATTPARRRSG